jgi:hypothetical protein
MGMRRIIRGLLAPLLALGLLAGRAEAQRAQLTGLVFDSTRAVPLAGAEVFLIGTGYFAVTNDDGRFFIPDLPPGGYAVSFRHERLEQLGYLPEARVITLSAGAPLDVLLRIPRDLPGSGLARAPVAAPVGVAGGGGVLIGEVMDATSGRRIQGATLHIEGSEIRNVTDARGRFVLFGVPAGVRELNVEMLGYARRSERVTVVPGRTLELHVRLATQAIQLDPIEVKVRVDALERVGFYDRRDDAGSFGRFFDRAEIERRGLSKFADLFHDVARTRVTYGGPGSTLVLFLSPGAGTAGQCVPPLYVDGMRMVGTTWDFISPVWVEAVEVYIGQDAPIAWGNACGVVLVWTRRGG